MLSTRLPFSDSGPPEIFSWLVVQGWVLLAVPGLAATLALIRHRSNAKPVTSVVWVLIALIVGFIGLPAVAFVESCDDHVDSYVAGLEPAERPGTVWVSTTSQRPGVFEATTAACGLSPDGSIDEDFDRTNHQIGLPATAHVFLSNNLWDALERRPLRWVVGPLADPPRYRSGRALDGLTLIGRVVVFATGAVTAWTQMEARRRARSNA